MRMSGEVADCARLYPHPLVLPSQVAACETAVRAAVADLRRIVGSAAAAPADALDPITFRLYVNKVRPLQNSRDL